METLAQLIADVAFAVAATALAHLGLCTDGLEVRAPKAQDERVIKRSRISERPPVALRATI